MYKITKIIYVKPDGSKNILHHQKCVDSVLEYKKGLQRVKGEKILLEYTKLPSSKKIKKQWRKKV